MYKFISIQIMCELGNSFHNFEYEFYVIIEIENVSQEFWITMMNLQTVLNLLVDIQIIVLTDTCVKSGTGFRKPFVP